MKGKFMVMHQRFTLNEHGHIIDNLNPANNGKADWCEWRGPKDEKCFRELLLWRRLGELLPNLIMNTNPIEKGPNGREYQPGCEESGSIWWALHNTIKASHLNTLDVALSVQYKFDGELKRSPRGWQDVTSLSLFVDDVERLLRDLYGESDNQAVERVRHAVFVIVDVLTQYLRKDLWQENQDAEKIDYVCGIGVPDGCAIHGHDHSEANCAAHDLELRARAVRANPTAFAKYTVEFVNDLYANWPSLTRPTESGPSAMPLEEFLF